MYIFMYVCNVCTFACKYVCHMCVCLYVLIMYINVLTLDCKLVSLFMCIIKVCMYAFYECVWYTCSIFYSVY